MIEKFVDLLCDAVAQFKLSFVWLCVEGIPDDRDGLFDTIQRSKNHYQKRAYQCIKMMVSLFTLWVLLNIRMMHLYYVNVFYWISFFFIRICGRNLMMSGISQKSVFLMMLNLHQMWQYFYSVVVVPLQQRCCRVTEMWRGNGRGQWNG